MPHGVAALEFVEEPTLTTAPLSLLRVPGSLRVNTLIVSMAYELWSSTYHQALLTAVWVQELPL